MDFEALERELHAQKAGHRLVQANAEDSEEFKEVARAAKSGDATATEVLDTVKALRGIVTPDNFEQHVLIAARVTRLFKEHGWDLVVVGGSALEFYTEGKYVSGDIDFCRMNAKPIPAAIEKEVMEKAGAISTGTRRQWMVGPVFVELLGEIETSGEPKYRTLDTPEGSVTLEPAEDILVDRVWAAVGTKSPQKEAVEAAQKMVLVSLQGGVDWEKVRKIAGSRDYGILPQLTAFVEGVRKTKGENKVDLGRMDR